MNNIDKKYQALLQDILDNGTPKSDRTGTGTISVFGRQIRHKMSEGFPLLTTKKMPFKTIVTELLWFLRGDTNIKFLVDNNCHIWDGDAYKNYIKDCVLFDEISNSRMTRTIIGCPSSTDITSYIDPESDWGAVDYLTGEKIKYEDCDNGVIYFNQKMVKISSLKQIGVIGLRCESLHSSLDESNFTYNKEEFINKIKTNDEFAKKWGELGPIYGKQWRSWETYDFSIDNDCHIWDGDAYKNYMSKWSEELPRIGPCTKEEFINKIKTDDNFAKKWGELGPIYGKQWRSWSPNYGHKWGDQISTLINDLKTNPDSRRLMVSAWNVGELDQMVLPPCHYGFQVYTRELSGGERWDLLEKKVGKELFDSWVSEIVPFGGGLSEYLQSYNIPKRAISLMYNARSQDVPLGTPFNISSYALLLVIIGKMVNMVPDELITNMGDCHIYLNQIDGVREQITREPFELPELVMSNQINFSESVDEFLNSCLITDFIVENYQSHPTIKMPLSN